MYETMTITFQIHYQTSWGQQIAITGNVPELGNGKEQQAQVMQYIGGGYWRISIPFKKAPSSLEYHYLLKDNQSLSNLSAERGRRKLRISRSAGEHLFLKDAWRSLDHPENAFYTAAFEKVIFKPQMQYKGQSITQDAARLSIRFQVRAVQVPAGFQLAILGSIPELGSWDYGHPVLLGNADFPTWSTEIGLGFRQGFEYKYGLYDPKLKRVVQLEAGPNRKLDGAPLDALVSSTLVSDEYYAQNAGNWKGAGVAIPVFSLRTENSLGIGEFNDLKKMIDWAQKTGLRMVQILPVNDTSATHTWTDSYPYAAITVFGLHPQFLHLDGLEGVNLKKIASERKKLNALPAVDYEAVNAYKLSLAREAFKKTQTAFLATAAFQAFFAENKHWLEPYAVFCYLRDKFKSVEFATNWGAYAQYSPAILDELAAPKAKDYAEVAFHYYLQFHLDQQLREASDYARSKGLILKGDLPIGIYRHSVDAWVAPALYNMDGQAGAPPDPFSDNGQNWGFPTYNWAEMAKDGYLWWRQRMSQLSRYFDTYRIDHILGFFRIWQIPLDQVEGTLGFFNPALPIVREELDARGIWFDQERYCKPYISTALLNEYFGAEQEYVRSQFLEEVRFNYFAFKPEWDTQRKVEAFFQVPENQDKIHLRAPLFKLLSNVLLLEIPGSEGRAFHPRIDLNKTYSFQQLDYNQQNKLQELYIDYFYRRQEEFWRAQAMQKLPALKAATDMLICGEDLGMVPGCVPGVMRELGILTLEIQRMSKNPATEFLQEADIPYLSVASPSTHDMAPIRAWWEEEDRALISRFFHNELQFMGQEPYTCEPFIAKAVVEKHLRWPSMWTVFPLQDLLAMSLELRRENPMEERINVPAIMPYYWRYRMHLSLENLLEQAEFNGMLFDLLHRNGRA
jgi:4-alpha-glucanotransferase